MLSSLPYFFQMYVSSLSTFIDSHSVSHHSITGNLQLHMSTSLDKISTLVYFVHLCISDIHCWTTKNLLKLNYNKADLILVTSKRT